MTKIYNDPADFSGEALSGFASAFPRYVQQVPGGLVRAGPLSPGRVAVVVGGGTGHYPAFAGWVDKMKVRFKTQPAPVGTGRRAAAPPPAQPAKQAQAAPLAPAAKG